MQKYAENFSFYVLKVQQIWHKIVTFSAPNTLDPLSILKMHLIINIALLWDQKDLYWRDSEIIKGLGLVLSSTTVQFYLRSIFFLIFADGRRARAAAAVTRFYTHILNSKKKIRGDDKYCVALSVRAASRRIFFLTCNEFKYFLN